MKGAALLTLLAVCAPVCAENWLAIGQSGNRTYYFDPTGKVSVPSGNAPVACLRYQPAGGCIAQTQEKIVYAAHSERGDGLDGSRWVSYRLVSLALDCTAGLAREEPITTFFDDATSRAAAPGALPETWAPANADARLEFINALICDPVLEVSQRTAKQAAASPSGPNAPRTPVLVRRIVRLQDDPRDFTISMGAAAQAYSVTADGKEVAGPPADEAAFRVGAQLHDEGDYRHAQLILRPLAERGLAKAQLRLGGMYWDGEGVTQDAAEANSWYRKAAEHGLDSAQLLLGNAYQFGIGIPKDDREAARWYRLAADQGLALAQYKIGVMYKTGEGVRQSDEQAIKWWRQAAANNDEQAQFVLGMSYVQGDGVRRDYEEAVKWLRQAARQAHGAAQIALGARYLLGEGVRKDSQQAYTWFSLAVANLSAQEDDNRALAIRNRERARSALSREEIAEAEAVAQDCLAHNYADCE